MRALASPERARINRWFFKTGPGEYGEGDRFIGLTVPVVRGLARAHRDLPLKDVETLLHSPIHEERLLALILLVERHKRSDDATKDRSHALYLRNTRYVNNWDLVDASAAQLIGAHLGGRYTPLLGRLARSRSVWERRIAMIATFYGIRQGDATAALRVATLLLDDEHDLIHKAVGWMLREVGKRCGPSVLTRFLDAHAARMPRTAVRYAIERLSPDVRRHYLQTGGQVPSR